MIAYHRYLQTTRAAEGSIRSKRYCDGTMQKYLESKWAEELDETKAAVSSNCVPRSASVPHRDAHK